MTILVNKKYSEETMKKLAVLLFSLFLMACGNKTEEKKTTEPVKKIVTVAQATKPKTLDPPLANQVDSMRVARQIFNTLLAVDDNGELVPEVAEKWEFENPKSILFTIRKGIKFHNGAELTVEDVAFSVERMREKAGTRILLEKISGVEVVDDSHVRILLSSEFSPVLYNLTLSLCGILNKEDTLKRGESEIAVNPNGTGPFKLVHWNSGDILKFEPFEESFMGKPAIDELIFKVIPADIQRNQMQQNFSETMYHYLHAVDDTRLVISNDGWNMTVTDICAIHNYSHGEKEEKEKYEEYKEMLSTKENLVGQPPTCWDIYAKGYT